MPELTDSLELRQSILEEVKSRVPVPPGEDEVTANSVAQEIDCTAKQARSILADMVEDGVAEVRLNGVENGKACKVYKIILDKDER